MPSFNAFQHPNRVGITAPSGDVSDRLATTEFTQAAIQSVLAGILPSGLHALTVVVSSTPYTVGPADFSLIVATGFTPSVINLPPLGQNRVLVVINDNGEGVYANSSFVFIPGINQFSSQIISSAVAGEWNWVILHDNGGGWVKLAAGQQGWQTYVPVYSAQINSSAINQSPINIGQFQKNGTLVNFQVFVTSSSSSIGSSMGFALINTPIPIDATLGPVLVGREGVSAKMLQGIGFNSSQFAVEFYDGTSPIAPSNSLNLSGWFRCIPP